jgi:ABC-2 type transport system permease protein
VSGKKLLRIFLIQLRNNFIREAVYRTNFFAMIAVDLIWVALEFALFSVLYANTTTLVGWTREQVYFFLGVFFASDALFTTFFQRNFWTFSDLVNRGELDTLLTRPVPALFLALTRWYNITGVFNILLGIGLAIRYAQPAGFVGGWHWLALGGWLLFGLVSAILLRFPFSASVFWLERSWAFSRLYYQFFNFATKPDAIYPPWIRYVILTALPFAFIGSVPARALLQGLRPLEYPVFGTVLVAFFFFDRALWKAGLRRYQSASS